MTLPAFLKSNTQQLPKDGADVRLGPFCKTPCRLHRCSSALGGPKRPSVLFCSVSASASVVENGACLAWRAVQIPSLPCALCGGWVDWGKGGLREKALVAAQVGARASERSTLGVSKTDVEGLTRAKLLAREVRSLVDNRV